MRAKKKDFKAVCKMCMNGQKLKNCISSDCLLFPLTRNESFRGSKKILKDFCKSCDPEGYAQRLKCETRDGCPLEKFYNAIWGKKIAKSESDMEIEITGENAEFTAYQKA